MENKKIAIIGVGGRTGAMFAFELKYVTDVLGVGKEREVKALKENKVYVKREEGGLKLLEVNSIEDTEFPGGFFPDVIFLTTKNPIGSAVEYYYRKIKNKEKLPALVLSQNGLSVGEQAKAALEKALGERAKEVMLVRVSLFNAAAREESESKIYMSYSLPIRLCFGVFSGTGDASEIKAIFKLASIEAEEIKSEQIRNMEFSKLFANLIGMASASRDISQKSGFDDKETFIEEVNGLREYVKVVRAAGGDFLNSAHYPIKRFAFMVEKTPLPILVFFRKKIWQMVSRGRNGREKGNLDEIDYYQGEVVRLGRELGVKTSVNEEILKRVKEKVR